MSLNLRNARLDSPRVTRIARVVLLDKTNTYPIQGQKMALCVSCRDLIMAAEGFVLQAVDESYFSRVGQPCEMCPPPKPRATTFPY